MNSTKVVFGGIFAMKVGDQLKFSPEFKFADLEWNNPKGLINAFHDRVFGFYIMPAEELCNREHGFACGVLCATVIDFVARIETGENKAGVRIVEWLRDNIREFDKPNPENPKETLADRFYLDFRNGLVHEGRIKNLGQFSYENEEIVSSKSGVMLINPRLLLIEIKKTLKNYFKKLRDDPNIFRKFKKNLMKDFEEEVKRAKTI